MTSSKSSKWLKISLKQPRIPEFYTLTKIHEKTPVGRPIVSGSSGPTERIYSFLDSLLQPITIKQDTTDFLDLIENTKISDNVVPMWRFFVDFANFFQPTILFTREMSPRTRCFSRHRDIQRTSSFNC